MRGLLVGLRLSLRFASQLAQRFASLLLSLRGLFQTALLKRFAGGLHLLLSLGPRPRSNVLRQVAQILKQVGLPFLKLLLLLSLRAPLRGVRHEFIVERFGLFLESRLLLGKLLSRVSDLSRVVRLLPEFLGQLPHEVCIGIGRLVPVRLIWIRFRSASGILAWLNRLGLQFLLEPLQRVGRLFLLAGQIVEGLLNLLGIRSLQSRLVGVCRVRCTELAVELILLFEGLAEFFDRLQLFFLSSVADASALELIGRLRQLLGRFDIRLENRQLLGVSLGRIAILLGEFPLLLRQLLNIVGRPLTPLGRLHRLSHLAERLARLPHRFQSLLRICVSILDFGESLGCLLHGLLSRRLLIACRWCLNLSNVFGEFLLLLRELLDRVFVTGFDVFLGLPLQ